MPCSNSSVLWTAGLARHPCGYRRKSNTGFYILFSSFLFQPSFAVRQVAWAPFLTVPVAKRSGKKNGPHFSFFSYEMGIIY
jgi:hypothetical protein